MKTLSLCIVMLLLNGSLLFSQVAINADGSAPHASAGLDVSYTNKGILLPRMTSAQRNAIQNPDEGLLVFNLSTGCFDYYLGGSWKSFCGVSEPVFQCGMKITDSRDGKMYNTVKIGTQCWMAENLNYETGISWCYNDNPPDCDIYGRLYDWTTMMNGSPGSDSVPSGVQGICPLGWHIPSDAEWDTVVNYLGGALVAGSKMKEAGYTHWSSPNTDATNESGFTALPGGTRAASSGSFANVSLIGFFYSSTELYETNAWFRRLDYNYAGVYRYSSVKTYARSLRCLMD